MDLKAPTTEEERQSSRPQGEACLWKSQHPVVQSPGIILLLVREHRALGSQTKVGTGKWQLGFPCPTDQLVHIIKLPCNIQNVLGSFVQQQAGQADAQVLSS